MEEQILEHKHEEQEHKNVEHQEHKPEHHEHKPKEFRFMKWLRGKDRQEYTENLSYLLFFLSTFLILIGIFGGSFLGSIIVFAILGSFIFFIGIIMFIYSQFLK